LAFRTGKDAIYTICLNASANSQLSVLPRDSFIVSYYTNDSFLFKFIIIHLIIIIIFLLFKSLASATSHSHRLENYLIFSTIRGKGTSLEHWQTNLSTIDWQVRQNSSGLLWISKIIFLIRIILPLSKVIFETSINLQYH